MKNARLMQGHLPQRLAAGLAAWLLSLSVVAAERPNLVLILADDLGWGDARCYNPDSQIPTPALDRLAAEGLRFTDAHSPSAVCTPTRYGLLTGRYPWRSRLKSGVLWGYSPPLIEPDRATLPSLLRSRGYRTACVGKWHLGLGWPTPERVDFGDRIEPAADVSVIQYDQPLTAGPGTVGFSDSFIIPASLDMVPYVYLENDRVVAPPTSQIEGSRHQRQGGNGFYRPGPIASGFTIEGVLPTLTAKAETFLRGQSAGQPFFLYFPLTAPHDPWVPTSDFRGRSQAGDYGDFVSQVDATVGRVLAVLEEQGLAGNTIVMVTSDNGSHWPPSDLERWKHRANGPWRGMKSDVWEGGHRVPFWVRWPARVKPGTTSDTLICLTDVLATMAELAGVRLPAGAAEDSVSFARALRGGRGPRKQLVLHSINGVFAVRDGPWKLIEARGSGGWSPGEVTEPMQLYRLDRDPAEQQNLAIENPTRVDRLRQILFGTRRGY